MIVATETAYFHFPSQANMSNQRLALRFISIKQQMHEGAV